MTKNHDYHQIEVIANLFPWISFLLSLSDIDSELKKSFFDFYTSIHKKRRIEVLIVMTQIHSKIFRAMILINILLLKKYSQRFNIWGLSLKILMRYVFILLVLLKWLKFNFRWIRRAKNVSSTYFFNVLTGCLCMSILIAIESYEFFFKKLTFLTNQELKVLRNEAD